MVKNAGTIRIKAKFEIGGKKINDGKRRCFLMKKNREKDRKKATAK